MFLDRDGVVNRERGGHTWDLDDVEILPDVAEVLARARGAGYLIIIITNQSGIGLGLYAHQDVAEVHRYIHDRLAPAGAQPDDVYYCPHHPSQGRCLCRKPGSLLLEKAIARHGIDPGRSIMIGDRDRDVEAAAAVGVRGVRIDPNTSLLPAVRKAGVLP